MWSRDFDYPMNEIAENSEVSRIAFGDIWANYLKRILLFKPDF